MAKEKALPLMKAVDTIEQIYKEILYSDYERVLRDKKLDEEVYRIAEGAMLLVQARMRLERARATVVAKGVLIE